MERRNLSIPDALALAVQHHQDGDLQEAENLYKHILSNDPQNADALHFLGVIAYQAENTGEAIDLIEKAIRRRSNSSASAMTPSTSPMKCRPD